MLLCTRFIFAIERLSDRRRATNFTEKQNSPFELATLGWIALLRFDSGDLAPFTSEPDRKQGTSKYQVIFDECNCPFAGIAGSVEQYSSINHLAFASVMVLYTFSYGKRVTSLLP